MYFIEYRTRSRSKREIIVKLLNLNSVLLQLQPRNFFFKRKQKSRKFYYFKKTLAACRFGGVSVILLNPVFLTAKNLFRLKLFLKRASRKSDYTRRFVWINAFPHLPLTKKPTGTRMGKGKGKLECWYTHVHSGVSLFEFKNLRPGRSLYYFKQLKHKLGVNLKLRFQLIGQIPLPVSLSRSVRMKVHW